MVPSFVYIIVAIAALIVFSLLLTFISILLSKPRSPWPHKTTPYATRRSRQNDVGRPFLNGGIGEERNETHAEAGPVYLERSPRTNGTIAQSHNVHPTASLIVPNEAVGILADANMSSYPNDGIGMITSAGPEQISTTIQVPAPVASVTSPADFPFTLGSTTTGSGINSQQLEALRAPIQHIPADASQMASIMQQMDELRAEVAYLRQNQMERFQTVETTGRGNETGSLMLPDYTSTDGRYRSQRSVVPHAYLHRSTSFGSMDSSEVNSTLLPDYSSVDGLNTSY